jgi:hypothetical protein
MVDAAANNSSLAEQLISAIPLPLTLASIIIFPPSTRRSPVHVVLTTSLWRMTTRRLQLP